MIFSENIVKKIGVDNCLSPLLLYIYCNLKIYSSLYLLCIIHKRRTKLPQRQYLCASLSLLVSFSCFYLSSLFILSCLSCGKCRTCAAARWSSTLKGKIRIFIPGKCVERQGILVSTSENMDWESPPSILVTRNPNWSQRWGTETGCVKGRY